MPDPPRSPLVRTAKAGVSVKWWGTNQPLAWALTPWVVGQRVGGNPRTMVATPKHTLSSKVLHIHPTHMVEPVEHA